MLRLLNRRLDSILVAFIFLLLAACVSVTLKTEGPKPAEGLSFGEPTGNFKRTSDKIYPSWIQEKTGNIISLLSECGSGDTSLDSLQSEAMQSVDEASVIKKESITYQQKEAVKTVFQGKVNGIDTRVATLVFKKSNCNFTFTFGGRAQHFDSELKHFETFLESIKVQ